MALGRLANARPQQGPSRVRESLKDFMFARDARSPPRFVCSAVSLRESDARSGARDSSLRSSCLYFMALFQGLARSAPLKAFLFARDARSVVSTHSLRFVMLFQGLAFVSKMRVAELAIGRA